MFAMQSIAKRHKGWRSKTWRTKCYRISSMSSYGRTGGIFVTPAVIIRAQYNIFLSVTYVIEKCVFLNYELLAKAISNSFFEGIWHKDWSLFRFERVIFRKNTARSPDCITKPIASRERRFHFLPCIQRATSRGSHLLRTCLFHYCPRIGHDERKLFFNTKQGVWQITKESFAFIWAPPRRNNIPRVSGMQIATCKTLGIVLRKFPSSVSQFCNSGSRSLCSERALSMKRGLGQRSNTFYLTFFFLFSKHLESIRP